MTIEQRTTIKIAMNLLRIGGKAERVKLDDGRVGTVVTYEDPFGGGMVIRCGGLDGNANKNLTVQKDGGEYLMAITALWHRNWELSVDIFDRDPTWVQLMEICLIAENGD